MVEQKPARQRVQISGPHDLQYGREGYIVDQAGGLATVLLLPTLKEPEPPLRSYGINALTEMKD
jgi:hypothetical protein